MQMHQLEHLESFVTIGPSPPSRWGAALAQIDSKVFLHGGIAGEHLYVIVIKP
jgi:hypothetical protein